MRDEALKRLNEVVKPLANEHPHVEVETRVLSGEPVDALVDLSGSVDLLVVGMKKHPDFGLDRRWCESRHHGECLSPLAICH